MGTIMIKEDGLVSWGHGVVASVIFNSMIHELLTSKFGVNDTL